VPNGDAAAEQVTDHYFTAEPASAADVRPLRVHLAGQELVLRTARGVFSPDRVDQGTAALLHNVPPPPTGGHLLDLGCGWGPVTLTLALLSPEARVWAVDVNERALDLVRRNAETVGAANVTATVPDDVPDDVRFTALWSNPPIRVGKPALHAMLLRWLPRLEPDGSAYLVVQRNLGADSLQTWLTLQPVLDGWSVSRHASHKGFRVLHVQAPAESS
jgi:16S rRNA G1207 methylase RsmC